MNDASTVRQIRPELRPPAGVLADVGLIVLSTDEVGAEAFSRIVPKPEIRVFVTRTAYIDDSPSGGEFRLQDSFTAVADTLPPPGALDLLAFNCTSGTVAAGKDSVLAQLSEARPGLKYTTPAIAGVEALHSVGARRIALLTPYLPGLHQQFLPFFAREGFEIATDATFALSTDREIGHLTKESIFEAAKDLTRECDVDALFISCTATPIVGDLEELERELHVPVIASSQALAWDVLRLVGYREPIAGFGSLLRRSR